MLLVNGEFIQFYINGMPAYTLNACYLNYFQRDVLALIHKCFIKCTSVHFVHKFLLELPNVNTFQQASDRGVI